MTKVHCTVSNCKYWGDGNVCTADEILVAGPGIDPGDESVNHHGRETEDHAQTPAPRADGSYCFTFKDKTQSS